MYSPHVRSDTISNNSSHLYFSVRVVGSGIHQIKNKELNGLTEVFTVQRGEVKKDVNRHLKGQTPVSVVYTGTIKKVNHLN